MPVTAELETPSAPRLTVLNCAKGGIGNQLFQHVFSHSLAGKLDADMATDTSFFGADPYGNQAAIWNLVPAARTAVLAEVAGQGWYQLKEGQIQSLTDSIRLPADAKGLMLDGYWQREALLDPAVVRDTYAQIAARARALVPAALAARIENSPDAIAVHFRRRDYGHMGLCKNSYYIAAIEHLRATFPDAELFVFSDEPNYARHMLQGAGLQFAMVSSGSDLGDLFLMSLCRHFVIANSSFSWWAAYFGEARGGLVCCPREWVTIDATPSPCPARWLQVDDAVEAFRVDPAQVAATTARMQRSRFDAAIRDWFADRGDQTLRLEFNHLDGDSTVFDLGGYKGDWTAEIDQRYQSKTYIFEPIAEFHALICARFASNQRVRPYQFGLGARDEQLALGLSADGTGAFAAGAGHETVRIAGIRDFMSAEGIEKIDLMKVNIEGGEFELLEHLTATGDIARVRRLQVQFHDFVPDAIQRRAHITRALARTHRQVWCYHFVWEEWQRIDDVQPDVLPDGRPSC